MKKCFLFMLTAIGYQVQAEAMKELMDSPYGKQILCLQHIAGDAIHAKFDHEDAVVIQQPTMKSRKALVATAYGIFSVDIDKVKGEPRVKATLSQGPAEKQSLQDTSRVHLDKQVLLGSQTYRVHLDWKLKKDQTDLQQIMKSGLPVVDVLKREEPSDLKLLPDPVPSRSVRDSHTEKVFDDYLARFANSYADILAKNEMHQMASGKVYKISAAPELVVENCKADKRFPKFSKAVEQILAAGHGPQIKDEKAQKKSGAAE